MHSACLLQGLVFLSHSVLVFQKLPLDLNSPSPVVSSMWCRQLSSGFKLISKDLLPCTLCCLYLEMFHKAPGQFTWPDFVYLLAVSWESMPGKWYVDWNPWPPGSRLSVLLSVLNIQKKKMATSHYCLISVYSCAFLNPRRVQNILWLQEVTAGALPWDVPAICLSRPLLHW